MNINSHYLWRRELTSAKGTLQTQQQVVSGRKEGQRGQYKGRMVGSGNKWNKGAGVPNTNVGFYSLTEKKVADLVSVIDIRLHHYLEYHSPFIFLYSERLGKAYETFLEPVILTTLKNSRVKSKSWWCKQITFYLYEVVGVHLRCPSLDTTHVLAILESERQDTLDRFQSEYFNERFVEAGREVWKKWFWITIFHRTFLHREKPLSKSEISTIEDLFQKYLDFLVTKKWASSPFLESLVGDLLTTLFTHSTDLCSSLVGLPLSQTATEAIVKPLVEEGEGKGEGDREGEEVRVWGQLEKELLIRKNTTQASLFSLFCSPQANNKNNIEEEGSPIFASSRLKSEDIEEDTNSSFGGGCSPSPSPHSSPFLSSVPSHRVSDPPPLSSTKLSSAPLSHPLDNLSLSSHPSITPSSPSFPPDASPPSSPLPSSPSSPLLSSPASPKRITKKRALSAPKKPLSPKKLKTTPSSPSLKRPVTSKRAPLSPKKKNPPSPSSSPTNHTKRHKRSLSTTSSKKLLSPKKRPLSPTKRPSSPSSPSKGLKISDLPPQMIPKSPPLSPCSPSSNQKSPPLSPPCVSPLPPPLSPGHNLETFLPSLPPSSIPPPAPFFFPSQHHPSAISFFSSASSPSPSLSPQIYSSLLLDRLAISMKRWGTLGRGMGVGVGERIVREMDQFLKVVELGGGYHRGALVAVLVRGLPEKVRKEYWGEGEGLVFARVCSWGGEGVAVTFDPTEAQQFLVLAEYIYPANILSFSDEKIEDLIWNPVSHFFSYIENFVTEKTIFSLLEDYGLSLLALLEEKESATLKDIVKWTKAEQILQVFIQEFMIEEEQCQLIIDNVLCLLYPWIEQNSVLLFRSPFYRTELKNRFQKIPFITIQQLQAYWREVAEVTIDLKSRLTRIANGTKKKEVCDWWLDYIEKSADEYLTKTGFVHNSFPDNYTAYPPDDIDVVKENLVVVKKAMADSPELRDFVDETVETVYTFMEELFMEMKFFLEGEWGGAVGPAMGGDFTAIQNDYSYLTKMKEMDEKICAEREHKDAGGLRMTDVVPVAGLVMARIHICECELQTVLDLWGNVKNSPTKSLSFDVPGRDQSPMIKDLSHLSLNSARGSRREAVIAMTKSSTNNTSPTTPNPSGPSDRLASDFLTFLESYPPTEEEVPYLTGLEEEESMTISSLIPLEERFFVSEGGGGGEEKEKEEGEEERRNSVDQVVEGRKEEELLPPSKEFEDLPKGKSEGGGSGLGSKRRTSSIPKLKLTRGTQKKMKQK